MTHIVRQDVGTACRALIAACLVMVGAAPRAVAATSGGEPEFALYQMVLPAPRVLKVSEELGFFPMPLINRWRFFDAESDSFDPDKYAQNIWTPDLDRFPGLGSWEKFGIPPQYPVWIDLDFEEWDPIFNPHDYPPHVVHSRRDDYLDLIQATRDLRPSAQICIHGLVRGPLHGLSGNLIETIVIQCDAISPSMASNFNRNLDGVQQQMDIKRTRILACLELKRDHGIKVLPVVSKRHRLLGPDGQVAVDEQGRRINLLTPPHILEQMMEVVLTTELDGLRIDGIIVWGNDNRILLDSEEAPGQVIPDTVTQRDVNSSEIRFLEIITEAVQTHWAGGP